MPFAQPPIMQADNSLVAPHSALRWADGGLQVHCCTFIDFKAALSTALFTRLACVQLSFQQIFTSSRPTSESKCRVLCPRASPVRCPSCPC